MCSFKNPGLDFPVPQINQEAKNGPQWKGYIKPRWNTHPKYSDFVNLPYIGTVPSGTNLPVGPTYKFIVDPNSQNIGVNEFERLMEISDKKFALANPTIGNVEKVIDTYESRPIVNIERQWHNYGLEFLQVNYASMFDDCISTSEEVASKMVYSTSTGFPANSYGFRSKEELLKDVAFQNSFAKREYLEYDVIWSLHPKIEFKEYEDLIDDKIRLFTIPSYELVFEQLRFGKKSSEYIMNYKWSAYGFNPYSGGTNMLAKALLSKPVRAFYDIRGWDKFLPIMDEIYDFVVRNTSVPEHLKPEFVWSIQNTINFFIKSPSGHVFLKRFGNPSGSGNTTRDNILGHIIILAAALFKAYYMKYNQLPSFELVAEQCVFIFGDDNIMALDLEFDYILTDGFMSDHFKSYGMSLKFFHGGVDYPLEKMQFLGFYFIRLDNHWFPRYDVQRLATAAVYKGPNSNTRETYLTRLFMLMLMSFPSKDVFEVFRRAYGNLCQHMSKQWKSLSSVERTYLNFARLTENQIRSVYLGTEASFNQLGVVFSSNDWWKEAIKDVN